MRTRYIFGLGLLLFALPGCKPFRSTHPQAELAADSTATALDSKSILNFAASADRQLTDFKKRSSLIFRSGDLTMYAESYSQHDNALLYRLYTVSGNASNSLKSFYLKNDSLILVKERTRLTNEEGAVYKDSRTYIRNQVPFRMDSRTAASQEALRTLPYLQAAPADSKFPDDNYAEEIKGITDALAGRDKFEMVFDNITTYPDARYITLRSRINNNYKASILVRNKDTFIDSLLNYPGLFRDKKLKLNWKIADQDAVYVSAADTTTSASGLNK